MASSVSRRSFLTGAGALVGAAAASRSFPAVAVAKQSQVTLTYLNSSSGQEATLKALNADYEKETGVKIELTTQALDYPQKLLAAAQAGQMPDLYYPGQTGSLDEHAPYVKAGWPLNLQSELDKGWKEAFLPELLEYVTYKPDNPQGVEPGVYSVPFDGNDWQVLFNPEIWKKADVDPTAPIATWSDFLETAKKFKKATSQPFGMNLAQPYGTGASFQTFATSFVSVDDLTAACLGKTAWTDPVWKDVLGVFEAIRDADVLAPGAVSWEMPDCEKSFFAQETLASYFGFAISIPVGNRLAPDFKDFSAMVPPPPVAGKPVRLAGGIGKSVAINAKGDHVDEALRYVKWFTEKAQQIKYAQGLPTIPSNPAALDSSQLDPRVVPFANQIKNILPPQVAFRPPVEEALNKGIQQLMNKETTADKIQEAMQQAQAGA
jgi:ABC-type glycerol-3-phosphate transport system substrate-binding protein